MPRVCLSDAAACYFAARGQMVIVGEAEFPPGVPTAFVAAHEYGHHVANNRRNPPFPGGARAWGTKRWASVEGICPGVRRGTYTFDPTGLNYLRTPFENFAEAFAFLHFPNVLTWAPFAPSLQPTRASYAAIRQDVLRPWGGNTTLVGTGRSNPRFEDVFPIRTPLDGRLTLKLRGTPVADFDLWLYRRNGRRPIARSTGRSSRERIDYLICGPRRLDVGVTSYRGPGRYRLTISRP